VDDGRPVVIVLGHGAHTAAGHALAHSLINLLARAHKRLVIVGELDRPLLCPSLFGFRTVEHATVGLARAINPYIEIETRAHAPLDRLISLGVGAADADVNLGADRWIALVGADAAITDSPTSVIGGSLAACLGSYAAFSAVTGTGSPPIGCWSAWDHLRSSDGQGPDVLGPVDVGRVLCAGAGAVASALVFFGFFTGLSGEWTFIDGDLVDVSNLNRQLAFIAADAGFPQLPASNKALVMAARLGSHATPSRMWYGIDPAVTSRPFDVVLALANEHGVRAALAYRQATVLLHATTSVNWQSQVHRHVAGHDDCLICRLPEGSPTLKCSLAKIETPDGIAADASLPYLSGTAGLMLLTQIIKLSTGHLVDDTHNFAAVDFGGERPRTQRAVEQCSERCRTRLSSAGRRRVDGRSRWVGLDRG
jgi:molybdopterin/thiamine biosynthesis adenylyltransferase